MSDLPCKNPNCKSHGQPHPNCRCYMAHGGSVCDGMAPHMPGCEYFADGGMAEQEQPQAPVHPSITIGHAAVHHGLLGLLKDVGNRTMSDPDSHHKTLHKAHEHMKSGDREKAANTLHGHPLVGGASKNSVHTIMERLRPELDRAGHDPGAFRTAADYLNSSIKGNAALESHVGTFFDKQKAADELKPDESAREKLNEFLVEAKQHPESLLDVGGSVGHYLPDHAAGLGALAATSTQYLNGIRPTTPQMNPLDRPAKVDKNQQAHFDRHLDIAQNPMLVLQHVRQGTLLPKDVTTLQTIYPALYKSMAEKVTAELIDARTKDKEIPYKQKLSLSMFLGQPLDGTMTPQGMQAIIASAGQQQLQNQGSSQKKPPGKPTAADLKQMDKVDRMYETPLERRQQDRKA